MSESGIRFFQSVNLNVRIISKCNRGDGARARCSFFMVFRILSLDLNWTLKLQNAKLKQQLVYQQETPDECAVCMEPFELGVYFFVRIEFFDLLEFRLNKKIINKFTPSFEDNGWRQPYMLKCKHVFCHECVTSWLEKSLIKMADCPICREKYTMEDLKPIRSKKLYW